MRRASEAHNGAESHAEPRRVCGGGHLGGNTISTVTGQHIEREARYALTKMTPVQRTDYVRRAVAASWSERQIARALGMAPSSIHYIVEAVKGRPHKTAQRAICAGCGRRFPVVQLDDGLCQDCIFGG